MSILPDAANALIYQGRKGPLCMSAEGSSSGFTWTPFTLTAGDSGEWLGYTNGDIAYPPFNPPVGLISTEPCSAAELEAFYLEDGFRTVAIFQGDIRSEVQGLTVTIDGVSGVENSVTLFGGNTVIAFNMSADFVQFGNYEISFTPA